MRAKSYKNQKTQSNTGKWLKYYFEKRTTKKVIQWLKFYTNAKRII